MDIQKQELNYLKLSGIFSKFIVHVWFFWLLLFSLESLEFCEVEKSWELRAMRVSCEKILAICFDAEPLQSSKAWSVGLSVLDCE